MQVLANAPALYQEAEESWKTAVAKYQGTCLYVGTKHKVLVCISPDFLLFQSSSSAHQCNHDSQPGDRPDLISASLFASLAYDGDALSLSLPLLGARAYSCAIRSTVGLPFSVLSRSNVPFPNHHLSLGSSSLGTYLQVLAISY